MNDVRSFDQDPSETAEWINAYKSTLRASGSERAEYILKKLLNQARKNGVKIPIDLTTHYCNTIMVSDEARHPGDLAIEKRIRSLVRWNALAMVMRANRTGDDLGGHIATYQSAANLYEIGFNHFFKGLDHPEGHDFSISSNWPVKTLQITVNYKN